MEMGEEERGKTFRVWR